MRRSPSRFRQCGIAFFLAGCLASSAAEKPSTAQFKVDGLGWFGNRKAAHTLQLLISEPDSPTLDANAIEDAALILFSELTTEGYLSASIVAAVTLGDGTEAKYPLDAQLEHPLPRPLKATDVTLQVERGHRFFLEHVAFEGLQALSEKDARAFFMGDSFLVALDEERLYSPDRLQRSVTSLRSELQQHGYADATVEIAELTVDQATGATQARIAVREGTRWRVSELRFEIAGGGAEPERVAADRVGKPWSPLWRQDTLQAIRRWYYQTGHPDVVARLTTTDAAAANGERAVVVTAQVTPGPAVQLSEVRFVGNTHTRERVLRKRVLIGAGDPLDRTKLDDGMSRIARLGVFNNLSLEYDPTTGPERAAIYRVSEGKRQEVNLLAGYGSYEKLRGGVEWRHFNLFGRAHTSSLLLVQSMKSSKADYNYTVPELFGAAADGSAQLFGLRREELAFEREEYGATASLRWPLRGLGATLTTGYTYQNLRNDESELATRSTDEENTKSASLDFGFVKDKRDSPLLPHRGYKLHARLNWASKKLGGETDYQQVSLGWSWHRPVGHGRWIHVGLAHAFVTTLGAPEGSNPPINVLIYPGGDDSIRGYSQGEAAPRDANGDFIGAKTASQVNLEFEQALTSKWSGIVFFDALGTASQLEDYPWSEKLYSVGVGIRYQTIIGPIRLEYGYNLNRRPLDPSGTLLFSVGFPF